MGFSLKVNRKLISHSTSPQRNEQFESIASMRELFAHEGSPIGIAIPYGIYEPTINRGSVFVGTSHDTAKFAAHSISKWWQYGNKDYENPCKLLILADGGGSNSCRSHAWKSFIQTKLKIACVDPIVIFLFLDGLDYCFWIMLYNLKQNSCRPSW